MQPNSSSSSDTVALKKSRENGTGAETSSARPGVNPPPRWNLWLAGLFDFFTSIRLSVACLVLGMVLVLAGTLAQVDLGLYKAQNEFFRSFLVYWGPKEAAWKIPVLPGGYLVGGVLLINLIASLIKRLTFTWDRAGLWMAHFGVILLLLGQLLTDLLARESSLHLRQGQTKNYSEADREVELAVLDVTDPEQDKLIAISQNALMRQKLIRNPELPFTLRVKEFYANSVVEDRPPNAAPPPAATQGAGAHAIVKEVPRVTTMEQRDVPTAIVELLAGPTSLGSWLVSEYVEAPQPLTYNNRSYQLALRLRRYYKPYSLKLLEFRHDVYPGTTIPKNFSSRVALQRPAGGENREVLIYMNNPLRYAGETYYQASFDKDNQGTVLQVVHNPSWLTPYFSCVLVGLGLVVQFASHLWGFALKRKSV